MGEGLKRAFAATKATRRPRRTTMNEVERLRRINASLLETLEEIKRMKAEPIGNTGFQTGPLAMFNACQRIARAAIRRCKGRVS